MDNFKFRFYCKEKKKYYYYNGAFNTMPAEEKSTFSQYESCLKYPELEEGEQYIGLKDINNKDVYVGDIIIFDNTNIGGGITKGEVIFNQDLTLFGIGFHLWVIESNIPGHHAGFMGMDWLGKIEIIGNINENRN
jgi:hypothetical protein